MAPSDTTNKLEISTEQPSRGGDHDSPLVEEHAGGASFWSSWSPKFKIILLASLIGLILLLAIVVILSIMLAKSSQSSGSVDCSLSKTIPHLDLPRAVYTKPGAINMAKMAGYIHIYDQGFLPLDIKRMTVNKLNNMINLLDDCVNVSMSYSMSSADADTKVAIMNLEWIFTDDNIRNKDKQLNRTQYEICNTIVPEFKHTFPLRNRYSCLNRDVRLCRKYSDDMQYYSANELVIESLELELDGNDEIIHQGEFSKPPFLSSCSE